MDADKRRLLPTDMAGDTSRPARRHSRRSTPASEGVCLPSTADLVEVSVSDLFLMQEELREGDAEWAEASAALEQEWQRYHGLFQLAPEAYLITDPDGTIREANLAAQQLLQSGPQVLPGLPLVAFVPLDGRPEFRGHLLLALEQARTQRWECVLQSRDRTPVPVEITLALGHEAPGTPVLRWLLRDLRERLAREAAREEAAAERARTELAADYRDDINHHVRNSLAMVSGLLQMQAVLEPQPACAGLLREAVSRVRALAAVHEQVTREAQEVSMLPILRRIAHQGGEYACGGEHMVAVEGDDLSLPVRGATSLAIVANELLAYGAQTGEAGAEKPHAVTVTLTRVEGRVRLSVWSAGDAPAECAPGQQPRMGLRLVWLLITDQLGGAVRFTPDNGGTLAEVEVSESMLRA